MLNRIHRFHGLNALNFAHKEGKVVRGASMNLKYARNSRRQTYRVAVVVSKKVSKSAVVRNRLRRQIYEVVRQHATQLSDPYDLLFMVYSTDVQPAEAAKLLTRAGLVV